MASTYGLGVFNDQFFKQAAMLIAVAAGLAAYQGYGTILFTVPFIIFAAPAGWMADRFSKRSVIIGAKALELVAMVAGAIGIYLTSWPLIFLMLFLMATQSAIFSPALNGSIPELYPAQWVAKANARLRVFVTMAILAGVAAAGPVLYIHADPPAPESTAFAEASEELAPSKSSLPEPKKEWTPSLYGKGAVAIAVVAIALFGLVWSLGVPKFAAANPKAPFPYWGPFYTVIALIEIARDRLLSTCVLGNAAVWGLANLQYLLINTLGGKQYQLGGKTSYLVATELVGIAIGGLLAGRYCKGDRWYKYLVPSGLVLTLALLAMPAVTYIDTPHQWCWFFPLLLIVGIGGGLMMIPMEAFIQIRPAPEKKGEVWASANFCVFTGILLSGPFFILLDESLEWSPTTGFAAAGGMAFVVTLYLFLALPKRPAGATNG